MKFFFYVGNTISPDRKRKLVALAYATARDQRVAPAVILIRLVLLATMLLVLKLYPSSRLDVAFDTIHYGHAVLTGQFVRSDLHDTTSVNGQHVKDPRGWRGTFAFKFADRTQKDFHVASHGYTGSNEDFVLSDATHTAEKPDATPRGRPKSKKVVWPREKGLEEYAVNPIGYSHLSNDSS